MENANVIGGYASTEEDARLEAEPHLQRNISWTGAFWGASGVPCLVLFSIGAIAAPVGKPAWLVWVISTGCGVLAASLILPVFLFRHYIQDRGVFPKAMVEHLGEAQAVPKRSGKLPYIVLAAGVVVVLVAHSFAVY